MAKRQPDSRAILDQLGRLIRHLTRETGAADDGTMNAAQRIALVEIGLDGPFRLNELAHRMGVSAPTASRAVDALEALGLAHRSPDPVDRRALSIELTAKGQALVEERRARAQEAFEPATAALSPDERRELLALLERMTGALHRDPDG